MAKKVEKNSRRGRPKTTGTTPMRSIRVPDEEWQDCREAAELAGLPLGGWIRHTLAAAVMRARKKHGLDA